jgi:Na+/melibiose symporter-like transporter
MLGTVLLVILILLLIGSIPRWNYNRQWGYAPFGGVMTILIIILILWALGII